jgi:hypothetical protein
MHAIMMARQFDEQPLIELGGSPGAEPGVDPVNEPVRLPDDSTFVFPR